MGGDSLRRARPVAAAPPERKPLPAWPSATLFPRSSLPGGCKTLAENTSAAAAAADAGLVFYNYRGHRFSRR